VRDALVLRTNFVEIVLDEASLDQEGETEIGGVLQQEHAARGRVVGENRRRDRKRQRQNQIARPDEPQRRNTKAREPRRENAEDKAADHRDMADMEGHAECGQDHEKDARHQRKPLTAGQRDRAEKHRAGQRIRHHLTDIPGQSGQPAQDRDTGQKPEAVETRHQRIDRQPDDPRDHGRLRDDRRPRIAAEPSEPLEPAIRGGAEHRHLAGEGLNEIIDAVVVE